MVISGSSGFTGTVFGMDDGVGGAEDGADDGGAVDDAGGVYVGALLDGAAGCV